MTVQPVPDGYHTITPYLTVRGATQLLDFVKQAFEAVETECLRLSDGSVKHASVKIGDSMLMLGEVPADMPGVEAMPSMLYLYLPDMQAAFDRAVAAGAEVFEEPTDHFYGDRSGAVKDACGNVWYLATHVEDVPPEEIERRAAAMGRGE
jgi:PhnB protein